MQPVDPGNAAALASIAATFGVGTHVLKKVLGPGADVVGHEIGLWTERQVENLRRIIENANSKMREDEEELLAPPPPRALARVMAEGSYCEDPIAVEYLGGVLASSRSGVSRDDRGAAVAALITRLSTYDLRTHYVMYRTARSLLLGQDVNLRLSKEQTSHGKVYLPLGPFIQAMAFTADESIDEVVTHCLPRLKQEALINDEWAYGQPEGLQQLTFHRKVAPSPGIVFSVSLAGLQLFCWAFGYRGDAVATFLDPEADFETTPAIVIPPGAMKVEDMRDLPEATSLRRVAGLNLSPTSGRTTPPPRATDAGSTP